ncbi:ROK family protein [Micromonospora sp. 067-2]|uniref:ROK family protein n=1 Tax=Micromonospora sp. 067-2 TaxID=2789270 RepID=UPI0039791D70
MKCALVRPDGVVVRSERHPTDAARGPAAVVGTILDVAVGLADKARADGLTPVALGIAVPGVVDEARGVAVWSANVGFRDVPLRDLAVARLGLPTALGHDVRVGGLAEARLGAGRGAGHVLFVAIGTGIAAAHVVDGTAAVGAHGAAGEIGHISVRPNGPRCGCGRPGCLEAVASAAAIGRRYAELAGATPEVPVTAADGPVTAADGPVTAAEVAERAAAGEPLAGRVWQEAIEALADGLATGQALFDVTTIVLGGGLAQAGDRLLVPLRAAVHERMTFHREPRLVAAALGDEAGCLGAALLALDAAGARDHQEKR